MRNAGNQRRHRLLSAGVVASLLIVSTTMRAEAPVRPAAVNGERAPLAGLVVPGLSDRTLEQALRAYTTARARGDVQRQVLSIIDYALPSTEKRLWVLDLERRRVLFHELVAHGRRSGEDVARTFSNISGSHQSSIGVFRTGERYVGQNGVSLRLEGLEPGINDRAAERAIVMHGAPYVSTDFAARHGRIGRSFGCPAVRPAIADSLIHTIRGGTLLFASYPDSAYAAGSAYVRP
jgi:hypothetical protein